jgi:hypothetical protein
MGNDLEQGRIWFRELVLQVAAVLSVSAAFLEWVEGEPGFSFGFQLARLQCGPRQVSHRVSTKDLEDHRTPSVASRLRKDLEARLRECRDAK